MTANRPRPHIPDSVKVAVAVRQLAGFGFRLPQGTSIVAKRDERLSCYLKRLLSNLAERLGCTPQELHLDHNPPLRVRAYNPRIKNIAARYTPNANDPEHLLYRTDADHRFKTNVKGLGAQHPDRVLIKKARRQERGPKPKRTNWPKRKMQGRSQWPKREFR